MPTTDWLPRPRPKTAIAPTWQPSTPRTPSSRSYQAAADRVAAMTYMSGRTGQLAAVLTAASPQQLIDQLSLQRVVAAETADQMKAFQAARERAAAAAQGLGEIGRRRPRRGRAVCRGARRPAGQME